jgi:hypothetical protein
VLALRIFASVPQIRLLYRTFIKILPAASVLMRVRWAPIDSVYLCAVARAPSLCLAHRWK